MSSARSDLPPQRQPWLHDLAVAVAGNGTVLSRPDGDVTGDAAQGFYVDDERVLSRLLVSVGEEPLSPVGGSSAGGRSEFIASARGLGTPGADPTVEVRRAREVSGSVLTETVAVVSRAVGPVQTRLRLTVGGDGAGIAAVKGGQATGALVALDPVGDTGPVALLQWRTPRHAVALRFDPPATSCAQGPDGAAVVEQPVRIGPGEQARVVLTVTVERTAASLFDADPAGTSVEWLDTVRVTAEDPRLERAVTASLTDLRGLLLADPESPDDIFAAAGTPWYLTLFGRDSLWTARFALPLGTHLAAGTLRALARRQGTAHDASRAEEPGKIPHELRRTAYVDPTHGLELPPVYYGTVDATTLWMSLLHEAWRWGMPEGEVRDLLPNLRAAAGWLTTVAPGDDGLVKYVDESGHGLVNQGWKDSGDSMRRRDGTVAEAPIALVEAQAYAVEAAAGAVSVLRSLGDASDAALCDALEDLADGLRDRIRERYWVGSGADRYLAMALDGEGCPVDGVGSNMGHVLGTGALSPDEAEQVTRTLVAPRMLGAFGIATLASDNGGYNPLGYHSGSVWTHDTAICAVGMAREGRRDAAATVALRLLDAAEQFGYRLPELYADAGVLGRPVPYPAACRPQAWSAASAVALLTVALGLTVDVPTRSVTVRPPGTAPFGALTVAGIRVGDALVTVRVGRDGVVAVDGLPEGFTLHT